MAIKRSITLTIVHDDIPTIGPGVRRAYARTSIALANKGVARMKKLVHRRTGTLSRSIHASASEGGHEGDLEVAKDGVAIVEVIAPEWLGNNTYDTYAGSWLPYAAIEAARGGSHDFFTPAVAVVEREMQRTFKQALKAEGL